MSQGIALFTSLLALPLCAQQMIRKPSPFPEKNRETTSAVAAAADESRWRPSRSAPGSLECTGRIRPGSTRDRRRGIRADRGGLILRFERRRCSHRQRRPTERSGIGSGARHLSFRFARECHKSGKWKNRRGADRRPVSGLQTHHQRQRIRGETTRLSQGGYRAGPLGADSPTRRSSGSEMNTRGLRIQVHTAHSAGSCCRATKAKSLPNSSRNCSRLATSCILEIRFRVLVFEVQELEDEWVPNVSVRR